MSKTRSFIAWFLLQSVMIIKYGNLILTMNVLINPRILRSVVNAKPTRTTPSTRWTVPIDLLRKYPVLSFIVVTPLHRVYIDPLVKNDKIVVFMKGTPDEPRCGFSNAVIQILRMHEVKFEAHDVLKDEALRKGIKEYSDWPTIPQVYIKGKFIGGCDILLQMHQTGDLVRELRKVGIISALKEPEPEKKKKT